MNFYTDIVGASILPHGKSPKVNRLNNASLKISHHRKKKIDNEFFFKTRRTSQHLLEKMEYFYAPYQPEKYKKFHQKEESESSEEKKNPKLVKKPKKPKKNR